MAPKRGEIIGLTLVVALLPFLASHSLGQEPTPIEDQYYVELSKARCGTLSECAGRGYRLVHSALPFLLLEKEAGPPNAYRYVQIPRIEPCDNARYPQQLLNQAGVFGYRLASRNDLANGGIMEKPPGRPNQYQYIATSSTPGTFLKNFLPSITGTTDAIRKP